ncbi:hypothetical protein HN604_03475 [archaeon]|jgi:hypothetical protein|nr:hypothetical protein [archaeon]MBT6182670.1 hypothetical protein [archaeon]MBT6606601.1 hypothetical protein [archaeon]MBT7251844.1 hypothetical protein [archaeon]MBT7661114.1 hypothetical protein [archaeon]
MGFEISFRNGMEGVLEKAQHFADYSGWSPQQESEFKLYGKENLKRNIESMLYEDAFRPFSIASLASYYIPSKEQIVTGDFIAYTPDSEELKVIYTTDNQGKWTNQGRFLWEYYMTNFNPQNPKGVQLSLESYKSLDGIIASGHEIEKTSMSYKYNDLKGVLLRDPTEVPQNLSFSQSKLEDDANFIGRKPYERLLVFLEERATSETPFLSPLSFRMPGYDSPFYVTVGANPDSQLLCANAQALTTLPEKP